MAQLLAAQLKNHSKYPNNRIYFQNCIMKDEELNQGWKCSQWVYDYVQTLLCNFLVIQDINLRKIGWGHTRLLVSYQHDYTVISSRSHLFQDGLTNTQCYLWPRCQQETSEKLNFQWNKKQWFWDDIKIQSNTITPCGHSTSWPRLPINPFMVLDIWFFNLFLSSPFGFLWVIV